jgi:hypothetical protein
MVEGGGAGEEIKYWWDARIQGVQGLNRMAEAPRQIREHVPTGISLRQR